MLQSFYTAFTALTADKDWLSVISDNIANVNTVGYKAERAVFEDLLARSLVTFKNGAPVNKEIGGGAFISTTVKDFSQGTFMNTNNSLDLALDGEGFFMVRDEAGVTYYTRNGQFRLDANGDLINMLGMKVQGWTLDDNGNMVGSVGSINVPMSIEPKETTSVSFEEPTNLDSRVGVITGAFDPTDVTTYHYVNSVTVYDSLGNPHDLSFYFRKESVDAATNTTTWKVYVYLDDNSITNATLTFNSEGNLTSGSPITVNVPSSVLNNGADDLSITVDVSRMKQVASDFLFYAKQNGNSKGDIMSIAVSEDGVIRATYTNGKVKDVARLAVATFRDKEILVRKGSWIYAPNVQTFTPIIMPGGVISKIRSGVLEMSNVDIANEFINLITAQRSYQANARIITTDDQILQETMNIKR
jgi:flagellar hook protein FlgE